MVRERKTKSMVKKNQTKHFDKSIYFGQFKTNTLASADLLKCVQTFVLSYNIKLQDICCNFLANLKLLLGFRVM